MMSTSEYLDRMGFYEVEDEMTPEEYEAEYEASLKASHEAYENHKASQIEVETDEDAEF